MGQGKWAKTIILAAKAVLRVDINGEQSFVGII